MGMARPSCPWGPGAESKDALTYHDRIVHDDSQRQDERHQREHVDGHAQEPHHQEGSHKRDTHSRSHPHGQPNLQKQRQHQENEDHSDQCTLDHQTKTSPDFLGIILPYLDRDAFRKGRLDFGGEIVLDDLGDLKNLFLRGAVHIHANSPLPVVTHNEIGICEAVPYGRDVTQANRCSVGPRQDDDVFEVCLVVVLPQGPDENFLLVRGNFASRQLE